MQVERVLGVYQEKGEEYLETYRVPLLSWEEVKALKGPDTVGLPLGDSGGGQAPGAVGWSGGCVRVFGGGRAGGAGRGGAQLQI